MRESLATARAFLNRPAAAAEGSSSASDRPGEGPHRVASARARTAQDDRVAGHALLPRRVRGGRQAQRLRGRRRDAPQRPAADAAALRDAPQAAAGREPGEGQRRLRGDRDCASRQRRRQEGASRAGSSSLPPALLLGLVLGTGFAVLAEMRDHRFRSIDDVRSLLELPMLGRIPRLASRRSRDATALLDDRVGTGVALGRGVPRAPLDAVDRARRRQGAAGRESPHRRRHHGAGGEPRGRPRRGGQTRCPRRGEPDRSATRRRLRAQAGRRNRGDAPRRWADRAVPRRRSDAESVAAARRTSSRDARRSPCRPRLRRADPRPARALRSRDPRRAAAPEPGRRHGARRPDGRRAAGRQLRPHRAARRRARGRGLRDVQARIVGIVVNEAAATETFEAAGR